MTRIFLRWALLILHNFGILSGYDLFWFSGFFFHRNLYPCSDLKNKSLFPSCEQRGVIKLIQIIYIVR